jgi:hypothetical protein
MITDDFKIPTPKEVRENLAAADAGAAKNDRGGDHTGDREIQAIPIQARPWRATRK